MHHPKLPGYELDDCIRAIAALVMALQEGGASRTDVLAALLAVGRGEALLRQEAMRLVDELTAHASG